MELIRAHNGETTDLTSAAVESLGMLREGEAEQQRQMKKRNDKWREEKKQRTAMWDGDLAEMARARYANEK